MSWFLRVEKETKDKFDKLKIEMWWIKLKTHDLKLNHLMWFFENYKNNNGKK